MTEFWKAHYVGTGSSPHSQVAEIRAACAKALGLGLKQASETSCPLSWNTGPGEGLCLMRTPVPQPPCAPFLIGAHEKQLDSSRALTYGHLPSPTTAEDTEAHRGQEVHVEASSLCRCYCAHFWNPFTPGS